MVGSEPVPDSSTPAPPRARHVPPWLAAAGRRFAHLQWLKVLGICTWMWVFFVGYFHVLRAEVYPVTTMPLTAVDRWIDFTPGASWIYLSLWVYVGIPAGFMPNLRALLVHGAWWAGLCASGLAIFYFWPTAVPARPLEGADSALFRLLQGVDAAGNACPSLHVATAAFAACWIDRLLREVGAPRTLRVINVVWFLAIAWSTMAIRQHVWLDVVAGFALGALFALPSFHRRKPGRNA
jgi:membrane-associated phospholipid phosphatase